MVAMCVEPAQRLVVDIRTRGQGQDRTVDLPLFRLAYPTDHVEHTAAGHHSHVARARRAASMDTITLSRGRARRRAGRVPEGRVNGGNPGPRRGTRPDLRPC